MTLAFKWEITEVHSALYVGEMRWDNKNTSLNVVEAAPNKRLLISKMLPGIKGMIKQRVTMYTDWRLKSRTMAGREVTPEIAKAIVRMHDMVRSVQYTYALEAIARMVSECKSDVMATKPATENHLWKDMEMMLTWADCLLSYHSNKLEILQKN